MIRPEKMIPQEPDLADRIWADIYAAAEAAAEQEPKLTGLLDDVVLSRNKLATAVSVRLARKLSRRDIGRDDLEPLIRSLFKSDPMVVEMSKGSEIGKYTGLYYTFSMAAQIATPILSGVLIDLFGYRILFPYAVLFSALAFVTMMQVRHGDAKPLAKKSAIEYLDSDD